MDRHTNRHMDDDFYVDCIANHDDDNDVSDADGDDDGDDNAMLLLSYRQPVP